MKNPLLILVGIIMIACSTSAFAEIVVKAENYDPVTKEASSYLKIVKLPAERSGLYYEHLSPNLANGTYERYSDDARLKERKTYKDGGKEGIWLVYYENNQLKSRTTYKDGKIDGISYYYQPNGEPYGLGIVEELPEERDGLYYDHSSPNLANGTYEKLYSNGLLEERQIYKNGKKEGLSKKFHENGRLQFKMPWKDGKKDGIHELYDTKGGKQWIRTYKDGILDGPSELYNFFTTGKLFEKGSYKDGKKEGIWEQYYASGNVMSKCFYENDVKFECE